MLITIFIFIFILGLLVFVHELGHFLVAKNRGMKVEEFGFGFPPRLIGFQKTGRGLSWHFGRASGSDPAKTIYSINLIPLGGFVRILGENNEAPDDPRSFINKPFWPRLLTLLGGVLMNVILAWVLISGAYIHGLPIVVDDPKELPARAVLNNPQQTIVDVTADSPAEKAGLRPNDIIIAIDGHSFNIESVTPYQSYIRENKGKIFIFDIMRGGKELMLTVPSLANPPEGQGPTGIALAIVGNLTFPWYEAIWEGAKTTGIQLGAIVTGLYHVITAGQGLKSLGGPVKIAQLTGQVAQLGFVHLIQFTALLSLNLAILNSLPFPALDGGRVLFLIIEKIRRKRNNQRMEQYANTVGFALLLLLMVVVTFRDVSNLGGLGRIIHKLIGG